MSAGAGHPAWLPVAGFAGAAALRALGRTWRIDEANAPEYDRARAAGEPVFYALWHSRLLALAYAHRGEGAAVLVSRHRDGELIARVIGRLGFALARGSSTRGGDAGARELIAWAERGRSITLTPDGPRGPAERVKEGIVSIASLTGLRVVPVASAASSAWVARSWDGFRVPRPFARVAIVHGEPLAIPEGVDEAGLERERLRIERALNEALARARERAGESA